jgi:hypothetical protein
MLIVRIVGGFAFFDGQRDADAIALERRDRRRDADRVSAARQVLALELLLAAFEQAAVEDATFREADVAHRALDRVLVELLGAGDIEMEAIAGALRGTTTSTSPSTSRRTSLKNPVANSAGRLRPPLSSVKRLADLHRQVAEDGSGFGALDAFDADITHHEGVERKGRMAERQGRKTRNGPHREARAKAALRARKGHYDPIRRVKSLNSAMIIIAAIMARPAFWVISTKRSDNGRPRNASSP